MKNMLRAVMALFEKRSPEIDGNRSGDSNSPASSDLSSAASIPVPKWRPPFRPSNDEILDRVIYYTNSRNDIVIFENGTVVIVENGVSDEIAIAQAKKIIFDISNFHPDVNPLKMDDGNILVRYNQMAYNVVIDKFSNQQVDEIKANHLDALATSEVLITPLGPNKFDIFGMKVLYGRCFMFMDAQNPVVYKIYRTNA